ncbi:MAG: Ig-like domain-containing protein [Myxococcota bacterium]
MRGQRALLAALGALAACEDATVLRLTLRPTRTLNGEREVGLRVERIELHVDGEDGIAHLAEGGSGDGVGVDRDGDGQLEWVASIGTDGALPEISLGAGASADRLVDLRVFGLGAEGEVTAKGGADGLRFQDGETVDVDVPFDLLPAFRPPRVVKIEPADGGTVDCAVALRLDFSEAMDGESVKAGVEIRGPASGDDPGGAQPASVIGVDERFLLSLSLTPGAYQVTVLPSVLDLDDRGLDQDPDAVGPEPFRSTFDVSGCE